MNRFTLFRRHQTGTKRSARARPVLERLESRTVLSNSYTAATVADLIAGINASNAAGGSNTIALVAGNTFTLTAADDTTDGGNGLPVIAANDKLTIVGNGDTIARSTASGTPSFRLFEVAAGGSLTLQGLALQNGLAGWGGAVLNQGTLDLKGVTVQNNLARWAGGGIDSSGSLTLEAGTVISGNQAVGTIGYVVMDPGGFLHYYPPGPSWGGGLYIAGGTASLSNATLSSNTAQGGAGIGRPVNKINARGGDGDGGAMYVFGATVTVSSVTLTSNTAVGGKAYLTGTPPPRLAMGCGAGYGGAADVASGTVSLSSDTLTGNVAQGGPGPGGVGSGYGGAVFDLGGTVTLTSDTVSNNSALTSLNGAGLGGGLYFSATGTAYLDAFTVAHTKSNKPADIYGSYTLIT